MGINKDQIQGRADQAKGATKEATGKLVGDAALEAKGNIQKNVGKVQAKIGDVTEELKKPAK